MKKYTGIFVLLLVLLNKSCSKEIEKDKEEQRVKRDTGQTDQSNADVMVQNILQWLQGVYTQNSRKVRQGSFREYLPPSNTQKPRPFEPSKPGQYLPPREPPYPPSGSITPQPPFTIYTNPTTGAVTGNGGYTEEKVPGPSFPSQPTYRPTTYPTRRPTSYPSRTTQGYSTRPSTIYTTAYPTRGYSTVTPTEYTTRPTTRPRTYPTRPTDGYSTNGYQTRTTGGYPTGPTTRPTGYPTRPTGYPTRPTGYPTRPTGRPTAYPTGPSTYPTPGPDTEPTDVPGFPTAPPYRPTSTQQPTTRYPTYRPTTGPTYRPTEQPTYRPTYRPTEQPTTRQPSSTPNPDDNGVIPTRPGGDNTGTGTDNGGTVVPLPIPDDDDLRHPPHIHDIQVQCAKDMMQITIEFNRQFDGIIYSKGFYGTPECRYVTENTGQTKYTFTVNLNTCGTEFVSAFDTLGQSYLENVLVIQNEPGVQEVWDTIRAVRCLWEGNLKETLSVNFNVGMLAQEIVTFSGDTAMARLDIQLGRGPFAPAANGLVKIGEMMTLVVSVTGDAGFDIQVKECRAKDTTGESSILLTDEDGCVLKPKLFGAFQKTRDTGNTGANIIAYAFFNAFKFPDMMDLILECNIELCKTDCEVCPDPNQSLEPAKRRRRRDVYSNETLGDPVTMGKRLSIILPEDLSTGEAIINLNDNNNVCLSTQGFVAWSAMLISLLTASCVMSASLWLKNQRLHSKQ